MAKLGNGPAALRDARGVTRSAIGAQKRAVSVLIGMTGIAVEEGLCGRDARVLDWERGERHAGRERVGLEAESSEDGVVHRDRAQADACVHLCHPHILMFDVAAAAVADVGVKSRRLLGEERTILGVAGDALVGHYSLVRRMAGFAVCSQELMLRGKGTGAGHRLPSGHGRGAMFVSQERNSDHRAERTRMRMT